MLMDIGYIYRIYCQCLSMFIYVYLIGGCKYVSFFNHSWDDWLRWPIFLGWVETCSMQPWRCSAPELWKGCIFLKCHVRGLSICMWSIIIILLIVIIVIIFIIIIIIITPYEDKLMLLSDSAYLSKGAVDLLIPYEDKLMFFLTQHICQMGWRRTDVDLLWR